MSEEEQHHHHHHHHHRKKTIIWRIIGSIVVAVQLAASVMLVLSLINTGVVADWIIILAVIVLLALFVINLMFLVIKRGVPLAGKITCIVLAVLCVVGAFLAMRYTNAFNNFLDKITEQKPEMKAYSVIVMNDSDLEEIEQLRQKYVGFLKVDNAVVEAEQYLQSVVEVDTELYESVNVMADVLNENIMNAIVLETDRMEMVKDESEVLDNTRVIGTFEIELKKDAPGVPEKDVTKEPTVIYISGSDARGGIKEVARTDVNIIAFVNPEQEKILLVSIPRDTYVQLRGTTGLKDKLSHSGLYGINMSKTTIEDLLDIEIDYTIKVTFETVVEVVDELDGIEIYSDKVMNLRVLHSEKMCNYKIGTQLVDGDCALRFARERKSYNRGDRRRGENQQQVLTSIINKLASSKEYLLKLPSILEIAANSFETTLGRDEITEFIQMQLEKSIDWQIESVGLDGYGLMEPTYSMGPDEPLYVMVPFDESMQEIQNKIADYLMVEKKVESENSDE